MSRLVDRARAEYDHTRRDIHREKDEFAKAAGYQKAVTQAQEITQFVAAGIQQVAHERIASIVTKCMRAVFDEPYEMKIEFIRSRGKTEARLLFVRDGMEIDPLTAAGGGVVDVAAFGLRLASLLLSQPPRQRILLLDEPFRFVSADYRPRVARLLESLADEMAIQFIIVTHDPEFISGEVVRIKV